MTSIEERLGLTLDDTLTVAYGRVMCVNWMYPLHVLMAYLLVVFGIAALVCRVWEPYKSWHGFFGRCFMYTMYWGYGTSLLILRYGLNYSTITFMAAKLFCLGVGYFAIRRHATLRQKEVFAKAFAMLKGGVAEGLSAEQALSRTKKSMDLEKTTLMSRLFSLKGVHGVFMTFAWYTMLGRVMSTDPSGWEGCWTYPAFKTLEGEIEYLPREDPEGRDLAGEMAFALPITFGGFAAITLIGVVYSYFAAKKTREALAASMLHSPLDPDKNDNDSRSVTHGGKKVVYDSEASSGDDTHSENSQIRVSSSSTGTGTDTV